MSKEILNVSCPECRHEFEAEIDMPDAPIKVQGQTKQTAPAPPSVDDIANMVIERQQKSETAKVHEAEHQRLQEWETGRRHHHFDPQQVLDCPNCGPALRRHVNQEVNKAVNNLSHAKVLELARNYGDWPPPDIILPF